MAHFRYYIDGYNVLHKSRLLRPLAMQDFESAREGLIDKVATLCMATGRHATIVFDGQGRHLPEVMAHYRGVPHLKVLYSPSMHTADTIIERIVYKLPNRLEAVVVSNDRGLRDACRFMGALVMEADHFLETVRESRRDISQSLAHRRRSSPNHLEKRLDADALGYLQRLKKKL